MSGEAFFKNTLSSLVLRFALGAIFIYSGAHKVTDPHSELGAAWASYFWEQQAKAPPDVLAKLDQLEVPKNQEAEKNKAKDYVSLAYGHAIPALPAALQYQAAQLAVAWGELIAGIALVLGLLTRLAAAGLIVIQVGAVYWVTWDRGFSFIRGGGWEYNLALLAGCVALLFMGGGLLSIDRKLFRRRGEIVAKRESVSV